MMMDSVQQWLADLRWMTECECMSVLQSKSLTVHENNNVQTANTNGATSLHAKDQNNKKKQLIPKSVKEHIDVIRSRAHVVSSEFTKIFSKIEKDRWKHVTSRMLRIASHLRSLVHECDTAIPFNAPHVIWKQEEQLIENCNCLQNVATELMEINSTLPKKTPLLDQLTITGQIFGCLVDNVLGYLVQTIVDPIVCQSSAVAVKSSIIHLTDLAIDGEHMCFIVAREGGVRALLNICHNESIMTSWSHALRTLATVCCVPEAISELEKENGVELLTDLLNDSTLNETIRSEAAGVIAQITSPGLEQYQHLSGFLENIDDLVRSLTVSPTKTSTPKRRDVINSHQVKHQFEGSEIPLTPGGLFGNNDEENGIDNPTSKTKDSGIFVTPGNVKDSGIFITPAAPALDTSHDKGDSGIFVTPGPALDTPHKEEDSGLFMPSAISRFDFDMASDEYISGTEETVHPRIKDYHSPEFREVMRESFNRHRNYARGGNDPNKRKKMKPARPKKWEVRLQEEISEIENGYELYVE
ncbi:protein inscuteable homolog isoform X2 [Tubulanus polymorphus]|uniref:protein inscuteable homolog isoform X2 n=1 Tax=Tubulanus polymorphus TaxID=672921 RepID=UPI003DA1E9EB